MAMIFMDGFDYYNNSQIGRKWDTSGLGAGLDATVAAYNQGQSFKDPNALTKTLPANYVTGFVGFHVLTPQLFQDVTTNNNASFFRFLDAQSIQLALGCDGTGAPAFVRPGTGVLGSVSSIRLVANTWYWLELKVTIDGAAGVAECKINGTTFALQLSGLNTKGTANSFFNQIQVHQSAANGDMWYDNLHVWDTTGAVNNSYIGEHVIYTYVGNATGSNGAWSKGGSIINANNYQQTNEKPADDDTTYIFSATPGQIDTYNFPDLTQSGGNIAAVAVNTVDRDDDSNPRSIQHVVKSGATTATSGSINPAANYTNHQSMWNTDPNTALAWLVANYNLAEFGVKEVS